MRRAASLKDVALLNLSDDSLASLVRKGNVGYVYELYNPQEAFAVVHHVSFYREDKRVPVERAWLRVHVLAACRRWLPAIGRFIDIPLCLAQIWWIARRHKVAAIRGRGALFASAFGVIVASLRAIPCVVSIGGNNRLAWARLGRYPVLSNRRMTEMLEEWVLTRADEVWCPNEYTRRYAIDRGVDPDRAVLMPWRLAGSALDTPTRGVSATIGAADGPIVLFVGRLEADKHPGILLEALPSVLRARRDVRAVFVGDGSLRASLIRRATVLGVADRVTWTGFQSMAAVKTWLSAASVVCIPMSGFVVFEAAALARPMVVCDVEWHSEFITNDETGVLVPDSDPDAMAQAVLRVVGDDAFARRLGQAAQRRLREHYDPLVIAAREVDRLERLIGHHVGDGAMPSMTPVQR